MGQQVTKRELREQARQQRRAREQALERQQRVRKTALWAIAAAVLIGGAAILAYVAYTSFSSAGSAPELVTGRQMPDEGQGHVPEGTQITYKNQPPSSGQHYPRPYGYGFYTEPVVAGFWVHNLEHGSVVILYNCPTDCA